MKINNIVFDLGNVLISYQPEVFHKEKGDTPEKTETFIREIYNSKEWQLIDKGEISVEEAVKSIALRSSLTKQEITRIFSLREELLSSISKNTALLKRLKKAGFGLYYISNFPEDMFRLLSEKYEFFRHFDGGIYSAAIKILKPDPRIYRELIKRYSLSPSESLFIDDLHQNVKAAEAEGFITLHLTDSELLEKELKNLIPEAFFNN